MVSVSISDIAGTVILLMVFVALNPMIDASLGVLLPQLGPTESLIAKAIPLALLVMIFLNPIQEDEPQQVVQR